jgi:hypothetical protein
MVKLFLASAPYHGIKCFYFFTFHMISATYPFFAEIEIFLLSGLKFIDKRGRFVYKDQS